LIDQITTSFNERKLKSNFYLNKAKNYESSDHHKELRIKKENSVKTLKHVYSKNNSTPLGTHSKG